MAHETIERQRLSRADHPENRPDPVPVAGPGEPEEAYTPPSFLRALVGTWLAGTVGSVLTLITIAYPLGAGDTVAALSILPLVLVLIAIVNGWIAANLFLGSGLRKQQK